jgi:LacI family transcriptional regulator
MATIYDVARRAGVSITTVSHVLNGTRYVTDETKVRVLQAVEEFNYRPSSLARALVLQETRTIALIVPDNINPFFAELARGVESISFTAGYNAILCNSDHDIKKERAYLDMLISKRVDGVIYITADTHADQLQSLIASKMPLVTFDRDYEGIDAILLDNLDGGCTAARHLIDLGHRRVACIGGPDTGTRSGDRVRGYQQALLECGIAVEPELLAIGDWSFQSGMDAARQFLALSAPPTAIFACNDVMATGAMSYLQRTGVRVPEDVSVIGFDNIALAGFTSPPLTTVALPILQLGQQLAQILLDRLNGQLPQPAQRIMLRGELLVRGSTAPAAQRA